MMKKIKRHLLAKARFLPDEMYLKKLFRINMGYDLKLDNPKTFNEKLQWLKIHDRRDIYTRMVDKYEAKKYVAELIGDEYVIPTLGVYDNFDEIDFDRLPKQFVIKCTHDSGGIVIVRNKDKMDKAGAKRKIERSLGKNYYYGYREWPYKNVKPRIIVEKYMEDDKNKSMKDYKFFCFNGKPEIMYLSEGLENHETARMSFYDMDMKLTDCERADYQPLNYMPDEPKNFGKMKEFSALLSRGIPHVRVDWYEINGRLYFGELTFTTCGGMMPLKDKKWDRKLGDLIDLGLAEPRKIKVMHFVGGLNVGGAQTLIKDYLVNLDKNKFDVTLLCLGLVKNSPYIDELDRNHIRVIYADEKSPFKNNSNMIVKIVNHFYRFFAVRSIIKNEKPDVLHTHLMVSAYTKFARPRCGTAIFYTVHSDPDKIWLGNVTLRQKFDLRAAKWLVRKRNMRIIVLHAAMKKKIDNAFGISNSIVLNNGVDLSKYKESRDCQSIRKKVNVPEDAFVVGHVGRMTKVKNQAFLVEIFARIYAIRNDALLLIVGDGPEKGKLMEGLRRYGLEEKCIILSDRDDIPDLLAIMDVFVLPSLYEGVPVSLIEAQESGLPCFVSDNISSHAFISNLVESISLKDNAGMWAEAILNYKKPSCVIIDDKEWDIKSITKKLSDIYIDSVRFAQRNDKKNREVLECL